MRWFDDEAALISSRIGTLQSWQLGTFCQTDFKCRASLGGVIGVPKKNCASREEVLTWSLSLPHSGNGLEEHIIPLE